MTPQLPIALRRAARRLQRLREDVRSRLDPLVARDRRDNEHIALLLAFLLREDSNCIDVGAHQGSILELMVRYAPSGKHLAFEPIPELAADLRSRFPAVDVRQQALASEAGHADFVHVTSLPSHSGLRERPLPPKSTRTTITVSTNRLDEILPADYAPSVIKIDVEGGEIGVIQGAIQTLRRVQPVVIVEHGVDAARAYGTTSTELFRLLCDDVGLRLFDIDGGGPYTLNAFLDRLGKADIWNWVAHR